ncbi:MAG: hypothetical protein IJF76_05585 [Clostridia bacterium]|nr:hypothetical protein [Clostridia bacterium]
MRLFKRKKDEKISQDWRLVGYGGRLNGHTFHYKDFVSSETNDHDHCTFCNTTITDLDIKDEEILRSGYCTIYEKTGQEWWVCEKCFEEFKDRFDFKTL